MYFDGCYFDPAYFDASVCEPSTDGGRRYRYPIPIIEEEPEEDEAFILALTL